MIHIVFATKHRRPVLGAKLRPRLFAYMAGIVRRQGSEAIIVGGYEDHVHLLVRLHRCSNLADLVRDVKSWSTKWARSEELAQLGFSWQRGYGAFSISYRQLEGIRTYIRDQERLHEDKAHAIEYLELLTKHHIPFDKHTIWD